MLISGSEVTAPKLFVSNVNGKIGLVGYWDCICFDVFHQIRNLVKIPHMVNGITPVGDEVTVHLITGSDQKTREKQVENLAQVQDSCACHSTPFPWEITLDRGLDLFH